MARAPAAVMRLSDTTNALTLPLLSRNAPARTSTPASSMPVPLRSSDRTQQAGLRRAAATAERSLRERGRPTREREEEEPAEQGESREDREGCAVVVVVVVVLLLLLLLLMRFIQLLPL